MLVLGLQGSPRKDGNTDRLLKRFLEAAGETGAQTETIVASRENILPCRGCGYCEKKGMCIIDDDYMATEGYRLLRQSDLIVAATPVFFYNMTAQLKALVDRTQALWSRKYRFRVKDPAAAYRKGILLAVGASHGKTLFDAIDLSTRYFFDAICASYAGSLTYRGVESPGDVEARPYLDRDIRKMVSAHVSPLAARKKIMVVGNRDRAASQMAAALLQHHAGKTVEVWSAGIDAAECIHPQSAAAMQEIGIDIKWQKPSPLSAVMAIRQPQMVIRLTDHKLPPMPEGVACLDWLLPEGGNRDGAQAMRRLREELEVRVRDFLDQPQARNKK